MEYASKKMDVNSMEEQQKEQHESVIEGQQAQSQETPEKAPPQTLKEAPMAPEEQPSPKDSGTQKTAPHQEIPKEMPLLSVRDLTKSFKNKLAVDRVSFDVYPGECCGIVGPNGAGKTTLIRSICTLLKFEQGQVFIGGYNIRQNPVAAKKLLGYVAEVPVPYERLTVWEHISFIARAYFMRNWQQEAVALMEEFDLTEKRDEFVKYLSKGQKQKLTIICALIHHPKLLLLDEPLIGIDARGARALKNHITALCDAGGAVFLSAHMLHFVEALCDRVMVMDRANVVVEGSMVELREKYFSKGDLEDLVIQLTGPGDTGARKVS